MHEFTREVEELAQEVLQYSLARLKDDPPLDGPRTAADLFNEVGNTITTKGLGGHAALEVFTNVLAKACISTDHPRNLAFIPSAPSEYANLFDLVVGASALYGGSWQEGAGAVFACAQESGGAQGLQLARHLRLRLLQERGKLGDRQLVLGAQRVQTQAIFIAQEAKEVGAGLRLKHLFSLCVYAHDCKHRSLTTSAVRSRPQSQT